jgi:coenzyme Q-binding protein COQ10
MFLFNPLKTHSERRILGYSMDKIHHIVADMENYPKFVPFCQNSSILCTKNHSNFIQKHVSLSVGFMNLSEKYTSNVIIKPNEIEATKLNSDLFKILKTIWKFEELEENKTLVNFMLEFQFNSLLHGQAAELFMRNGVETMVQAFENRVYEIYGKPNKY